MILKKNPSAVLESEGPGRILYVFDSTLASSSKGDMPVRKGENVSSALQDLMEKNSVLYQGIGLNGV